MHSDHPSTETTPAPAAPPVSRLLVHVAKADYWIALAIFTLLAYTFVHSPVTYIGDSKYCLLLSENLLSGKGFTLDDYQIPRRPTIKTGDACVNGDIYQIEVVNGHFYYYLPPGSSILSAPFVALMDHLGRPIVGKDGVYSPGNETRVQARLAALLMAVLGGIFYFTGRLVLPAFWSVGAALGGTLGTQVWSTASRALWAHTWGLLLLGWIVYLLLASETGRRRLHPVLLATLLAWTYFVRPTNSLFVVGVTVYVVLYARALFIPYALAGAAWFAVFAGWSWWSFGRLLPGYFRASRLGSGYFWEALAGNLVSPSRGLLVLVPGTLFVMYLVARYWRLLAHRRLLVILLAAGLGQLLVVASFIQWIGGYCFGPRFSTELVPTLVLAAVLGIAAMRRAHAGEPAGAPGSRLREREGHATLAAGGALALLSIWINGRGANALPTSKWNLLPATVNSAPERVWDWRYPQVLAGIVPMPQPATLPVIAGRITFGGRDSDAYEGDGWTQSREADLRWTEDPLATLFFAGKDIVDSDTLRLKLAPYVNRKLGKQHVKIDLNGHRIASFILSDPRAREMAFPVPAGVLQERNLLTFRLPDAASPSSLGVSSDPRLLGIAMYWLGFEKAR